MKNSLKNTFPNDKLFSQSGISYKWKNLFLTSQKNSFFYEQRGFSLKIAFRIVSIMVFTSKKLKTKENYFTYIFTYILTNKN